MNQHEYETDVSGEIEEARQLAHEDKCRMRDIEQGCNHPGEDEE